MVVVSLTRYAFHGGVVWRRVKEGGEWLQWKKFLTRWSLVVGSSESKKVPHFYQDKLVLPLFVASTLPC